MNKMKKGIAGEVMIYSCTLCGAKSSLLGTIDERMEHLKLSHNISSELAIAKELTMKMFKEWRSCEIYEDD